MSDDEDRTISFRVPQSLIDDFDRAIVEAQADGIIEINTSRSEALRILIRRTAEDPTLLDD